MKLGLKKIVGKVTLGDEYGLYRENDEKKHYLMVSFSTWKEMDRYGRGLAKLFDRKFDNWVAEPEHEEDEETMTGKAETKDVTIKPKVSKDIPGRQDPKARPKARRVTGVAKTVQPMIAEGKSDEEIFVFMLPKYLEAGRTKTEAKDLLIPYLKDIRAGKI